jgi:hypothetical protein
LITLGSPADIEARRASLDLADPLAALECAISTGKAPRPLTDVERVGVGVHALVAACAQLNSLGSRALYAQSFHYLIECFGATSSLLAWNSCRAIEDGRVGSADLLRLAIAVIPLVAPDTQESGNADREMCPTDSMLRDLWSTCPPLAARYDVTHAGAGDVGSIERCEEFLGLHPGLPVPTGAPVEPHVWLLNIELLRRLRQAMELQPTRILDLDALAEANFEWLLAQREGRINSKDWCVRHFALEEPPGLDERALEHLKAHRPEEIVDKGMMLSRGVLMASFQIAAVGHQVEQAAEALLPLVDVLPRMLTRDLTLALVLLIPLQSDFLSRSSVADA